MTKKSVYTINCEIPSSTGASTASMDPSLDEPGMEFTSGKENSKRFAEIEVTREDTIKFMIILGFILTTFTVGVVVTGLNV